MHTGSSWDRIKINLLKFQLGYQFAVHYSLHHKEDIGGVITIYNHSIWKEAIFYSIAPGRILTSELDDKFVIINVHNHGLSAAQVKELYRIISEYAARGVYVLLLGDFNIPAHGRYYVSESYRKSDAPVTIHASYHAGLFRTIFDMFIEIYQPDCTHFSSANNSISCLDRAFVLSPSHLSLSLHFSAKAQDPIAINASPYRSDHGPLHVTISLIARIPPQDQPISSGIPCLPRF